MPLLCVLAWLYCRPPYWPLLLNRSIVLPLHTIIYALLQAAKTHSSATSEHTSMLQPPFQSWPSIFQYFLGVFAKLRRLVPASWTSGLGPLWSPMEWWLLKPEANGPHLGSLSISLPWSWITCSLFFFSQFSTLYQKSHLVLQSVISTLPLWLLGFARLLVTKSVDYHEHVSEYGVHWNFFFTLAIVKVG